MSCLFVLGGWMDAVLFPPWRCSEKIIHYFNDSKIKNGFKAGLPSG